MNQPSRLEIYQKHLKPLQDALGKTPAHEKTAEADVLTLIIQTIEESMHWDCDLQKCRCGVFVEDDGFTECRKCREEERESLRYGDDEERQYYSDAMKE